MLYLVDFRREKNSMQREAFYGIYSDVDNSIVYYNYRATQDILSTNNQTIKGLAYDYGNPQILLFNEKFIRVEGYDNVPFIHRQQKNKKYVRARDKTLGITINLDRPVSIKKPLSGCVFYYKRIRISYERVTNVRLCWFIELPNWKNETLVALDEICNTFTGNVVIGYQFKQQRKGISTLDLSILTNILNKYNLHYHLFACSINRDYDALDYVNLGSCNLSKTKSLQNIIGYSRKLQFVDICDTIIDGPIDIFVEDCLSCFLNCIYRNIINNKKPIILVCTKEQVNIFNFLKTKSSFDNYNINVLGFVNRSNVRMEVKSLLAKQVLLNKLQQDLYLAILK